MVLEGALVEVGVGSGILAFNVVGLPDAAVQEAKERLRAAVKNSGCVFPQRRITVNLAPTNPQKWGPRCQTGKPSERKWYRRHVRDWRKKMPALERV